MPSARLFRLLVLAIVAFAVGFGVMMAVVQLSGGRLPVIACSGLNAMLDGSGAIEPAFAAELVAQEPAVRAAIREFAEAREAAIRGIAQTGGEPEGAEPLIVRLTDASTALQRVIYAAYIQAVVKFPGDAITVSTEAADRIESCLGTALFAE